LGKRPAASAAAGQLAKRARAEAAQAAGACADDGMSPRSKRLTRVSNNPGSSHLARCVMGKSPEAAKQKE
jgi:hypothetical protein